MKGYWVSLYTKIENQDNLIHKYYQMGLDGKI